MPSSNASRAEGQKLPGVMPPMSYWCRQLVTQQKSSPFQNTGQSSITSIWCAAPTHGSLARNMSPSRDARVVAAVLERPLHLRVGDAGHVLHVRAEIDELGVLGEDRRVEVERVHRHRRAGEALDRRAVLLVHVPQRVAHDLEGHRVDAAFRLAVELELRRDPQLLRRHVARCARRRRRRRRARRAFSAVRSFLGFIRGRPYYFVSGFLARRELERAAVVGRLASRRGLGRFAAGAAGFGGGRRPRAAAGLRRGAARAWLASAGFLPAGRGHAGCAPVVFSYGLAAPRRIPGT